MDAREFGQTGVHVSPITLGSWPMSGDRYGAIDDSEAINTIRVVRDQGITSFDTAPGYGSGHAEETLGAASTTWAARIFGTTSAWSIACATRSPHRRA